MTLKEKFAKASNNGSYYVIPVIEDAGIIEKIADDYAIEFNKWTHNLRDCNDDTIEYNQWLNISDEELLIMFKKEKGLCGTS